MTEVLDRVETPRSNGAASQNLPALAPPRLPYHPAVEERFGIDKASWKALVEAIFPNASSTESVILALSYCRARKLDPFKRNVHIVPIWNKDLRRTVDTVWPGIGELRTTAFRTGEYAGRDATMFGDEVTQTFTGSVGRSGQEREVSETVKFPEWAQTTVYRFIRNQRVAFAGPRVYWIETYSTQGRTDVPNEMWLTRPRGQLDKCSEAASLRAAFPEEIGNEYIGDEVGRSPRGEIIEQTGSQPQARGVASVKQKLTQRPLSAGQTLETDTGEVIEQGEEPVGQPAAQQLQEHDFAVDSPVTPQEKAALNDAERPSSPQPSPQEQFYIQLDELAQAKGITDLQKVHAIVERWADKRRVKGKEHTAKLEDVKALLDALATKSGIFADC